MAYRPEMLLKWETGSATEGDEVWQAELWRLLREDVKEPHPPALFKLFKEKLKAFHSRPILIPERISMIGISSLPSLWIDVILTLSSLTDVHLFLLNPCREYWSEILSEREREKRQNKGPLGGGDILMDKGNPLLASMGKTGRDFLFAFADIAAEHRDYFVRPGESTALRTIQSDILNLLDRGKGEAPRLEYRESDDTIECHACHSPLREVEVLYDRLLSLFENDQQVKPRDILVMTPNIDIYAPFIESVFSHSKEENPKAGDISIPFGIADGKPMRDNPIIVSFFKILDLAESRFEASRVTALLDRPLIRRAFGIASEEIPLIHRWIKESGIRWGIDEDALIDLGLPYLSPHSWQDGIDRMLLGYALPGENKRLYDERLPYDGIEGEKAETLGRFIDFLACLIETCKLLRGRHSLHGWRLILHQLCETFFHIDENEEETFFHLKYIMDVLQGLSESEELSGYEDSLPLSVIRAGLTDELEKAGFSGGFLSGGVTFCAMVPMRSIPFKVICLLGMNQELFPREPVKAGFDLIERRRRRGDPSIRDEDRYLFLETILSARERLIIFFTGQNIRDNTVIPPSVVVSELLDYLEHSSLQFPVGLRHDTEDFPSMKERKKHWIINHPLQPFSPDYFTGSDIFYSYNEENCRAARSLLSDPLPSKVFFSEPLPSPDAGLTKSVEISDLVRFFRHPPRFFCEQSLGIRLPVEEEPAEDVEPFTLKGLSRYGIRKMMLDSRMNGERSEQEYHVLKESGHLPVGTVGQYDYEVLTSEVEIFFERLHTLQPAWEPEKVMIDLTLGDIRLAGQIMLSSPQGFVHYRYGDLRGRDHLNAWLLHLILGAVFPNRSWRNVMAGTKSRVVFDTPGEAKTELATLLDIYRDGLTRPLPFFPQTSMLYAEVLSTGKSREEALSAARGVWQPSDFTPSSEGNDPYQRICFGKTDPLREGFCTLSETVFKPILEHRSVFDWADLPTKNIKPH
jgi:exodeoxyribonuclease V gamma subunit